MRFALLGSDPDALALAATAAGSDRHELTCLVEVPERDAAALRALAPRIRTERGWEALLTDEAADAAIVAADPDEERRAEQLRKLIQERKPLLVAHPVFPSMLLYYELDMIRRETGCVVQPYLPARWHPAVEFLQSWTGGDAPFGRLEQVVVERTMENRSQRRVLEQFARDVDLLRALCGEPNKVSALAPSADAAGYAALGVQLSGPSGVAVRWSVAPARDEPAGKVTLWYERGEAVLRLPARGTRRDEPPWRLEVSTEGKNGETWPDFDPPGEALETFARAVAGEAVRPDWSDAARSVELAEAVERSLRRGRTVELYHEDFSEEATFKGTMTSLGCGILMFGLATLVVAAAFGQHGRWLYVLLVVFGAFLALQLFRLVFRGRPKAGEQTAQA